jgi:CRISPR-associated protein Cas5h
MKQSLISFDLRAGFGVFKKPDVNEGLQMTFNMLHRPALLGILGAIAGLEGYQEKGVFPAYYQKLRGLPVGIEPLDHEKGNFTKTVIKYTNTVGYANKDGNLIITEQTLCSPAYRCYLLLDLDDPVHALLNERIQAGEAEYLPYFGKNECSAWWDVEDFRAYQFSSDKPGESFPIATIFRKDNLRVRDEKENEINVFDFFDFSPAPGYYLYFERLPVDFDERMFQYRIGEFAFINFPVKPNASIDNLYFLKDENKYVSLF